MRIPPAPRTRGLRAAALIAAVEGAGFVLYAVMVAVEVARHGLSGPAEVSNVPAVVLEVAIFAAFGAALLAAGHGLWGSRRWARSPFLVAQLLGLVVGVPLAQATEPGPRTAGILLAVLSLVGLVLCFAPGVSAELDGDG